MSAVLENADALSRRVDSGPFVAGYDPALSECDGLDGAKVGAAVCLVPGTFLFGEKHWIACPDAEWQQQAGATLSSVDQGTLVLTAEFGHDCHKLGVQIEIMEQQNSEALPALTPSKITAWLDCPHYLNLKHQRNPQGSRGGSTFEVGTFARLLLDKDFRTKRQLRLPTSTQVSTSTVSPTKRQVSRSLIGPETSLTPCSSMLTSCFRCRCFTTASEELPTFSNGVSILRLVIRCGRLSMPNSPGTKPNLGMSCNCASTQKLWQMPQVLHRRRLRLRSAQVESTRSATKTSGLIGSVSAPSWPPQWTLGRMAIRTLSRVITARSVSLRTRAKRSGATRTHWCTSLVSAERTATR